MECNLLVGVEEGRSVGSNGAGLECDREMFEPGAKGEE